MLKKIKQLGKKSKILPLSRTMPIEVGVLHFVGIGGIGMSGIAEVLHNLGYKVQGSDLAESANVERLRELGIPVTVGHAAENLGDASVVVISSAVKKDNPEMREARARGVPVIRRAEMLAELMRLKMSVAVAGTHGKTTTTSMMAALFETAGVDPTVINGGIINAYGTNAHLGKGDWMVVESDESDGSFIHLPITIGIVTNIDPEHMEFYGDFESVKAAFRQFVHNVPFYGFCVMCSDHAVVKSLLKTVHDRRIITYGLHGNPDVRAVNIKTTLGGATYDVELSERVHGGGRVIKGITLPMPGMHNVQNSLATIAVANELKFSDEVIREAFVNYKGVKRRFTRTGTVAGVTVVDDYGHHPVEIAATLKAARETLKGTKGCVIAVVQPHRYTRLKSLYREFCECFDDADAVIVADVYAAGEKPIKGVNSEWLVSGLKKAGHAKAVALESEKALPGLIAGMAQSGDLVVCLGAGSITKWAYALPGQLAKEWGVKDEAVA